MTVQKPKVKSADRVLDILELFTGEQDHYNLTEISRSLNMPPSSTYQLIQNMVDRGYLEEEKSGKRFRIGYKLFMIRSRYMQGTSLTSEFYQLAERIIHDVNETVSLAIRRDDQLLYIAEKVSTRPLRYTPNLGGTLPLHATASGKVFLAYLDEEELLALYPQQELEPVTAKTIRSFSSLLQELKLVREQGFGYNEGETVEGVHCIAGPVWDHEHQVAAAVSISIPEVRMTEGVRRKLHEIIRQACNELTYRVFQQQ
ncbi:IclR family transcriptional regulator [Paenibacillus sp. J2TS4]|uniref:IclR family transcriptional regulator n=1 Tax=Paenibacillus sp. J2TS4 TaxID=2807194 RepID=UPI001B17B32C|nr:IclR family transcriptional regulator [Paenibacillus sp. J2TS4]GIP31849.1 transcriptional regulator [Paenibacillus sp. J2TS4]